LQQVGIAVHQARQLDQGHGRLALARLIPIESVEAAAEDQASLSLTDIKI
jgi:hypothetical protein